MFPNGAEFCLSLRPAVEMCTNFPYWTSQWNHLKGALDDDSKHYVLKMHEVARSYGVPLYFLLVGSSLEDPDIDYMKQLVAAGHEVGNHTYTHLNVKAKTIESLQAVYANAPWRAHGRTPLQVIHDEVRATNAAIRERLGVTVTGFGTPGAFSTGLHDVTEVQALLKEEGFTHVTSHYLHPSPRGAKRPPLAQVEAALRKNIDKLQPYRYPNGLLEIAPMALTDIAAFRVLDLDRWEYVRLLKTAIDHAHANRYILSLAFHPPAMAARDPHCDVLDTVIRYALEKPGGCWIATNSAITSYLESRETEG